MKRFTKKTTSILLLFVTLISCKVDIRQNNSATGNKIVNLRSCKVVVGQNNSATGNKNVITEERAITESITKIEVQEGITVYLTMGSKDMLTVETDENLMSLIKTEFKNGNLKIFCEPNIKKSKARNVYLTADKIQTIETSSGARVISENTLIADVLTVHSSSGSHIDLQINADKLTSSSSSGSHIKLKGRASNFSVKSSSGSSINAYKLNAKNVESKASSGSHIKVTATESLKGKASSGGSINHKGNAKNIERKTSSGGNVSAG